jgi:proton glutamate symport protein
LKVEYEGQLITRKPKISLANQIVIAMILGIAFGYFFPTQSVFLKPIADMFFRMVKMLIVPLLFSGLVMGIAGTGSFKKMGRLGAKSIIWFWFATTVSLILGLVLGNIFQPGVGVDVNMPVNAAAQVAGKKIDLLQFVIQIVPTNIVDAMANANLLQIVFFSCFFGVAVAAIGSEGQIIVNFASTVLKAMFKVTNYVMVVTPLAVFSSLAYTIGTNGLGMVIPLGKLILTTYLGLAILILTVFMTACAIIKVKFWQLLKVIKQPTIIAFTTCSSEAALPYAMARLEKFGIPKHIVNFVLPTGYSFNLDGMSMYLCLASLFVAQVYNIHMDLATQITMLLTMMIMSKGIAGVPGGTLVILASCLTMFNIPVEGIALIMGVDRFMEMGRTATNVIGNSIAAVIVSRWEKELPDEVIQLGYTKNYDEA